ncbi:MAG: GDP-L-fucose synthase family protein [Syntrophobacteraceae bacterium]
MNKDDKIFVAGHRGLVGSAIMRKLRAEGYSRIIVRTHSELDLTEQAAVNRFFEAEKPQYLFIAAARVGGINANNTYPADFIRDNLAIQTNVIDAAYRNGVAKLLFLGSACIYPKMAPQPIKEEYLLTGPLEPTNEWYALAKIAGIKMCQAYRRQYGFNAISVMPTNLYGPNDNFDLEKSHVLPALIRKFHLAKLAVSGDSTGVLSDEERFGPIPEPFRTDLLTAARNGAKIQRTQGTDPDFAAHRSPLTAHSPLVTLWGTGTPRREFLHVDDLADACFFLMQHYNSGEILNIGVGEDLTIGELAKITRETVGFREEVSYDASKPDGTPQRLLDDSRLRPLGWSPKVGLHDGIRRTYEWYLQNR